MRASRVPVVSGGPLPVAVLALALDSCGGISEPVALHLLDLFPASTVAGTVETAPVAPTEWRFDGTGTIEVDGTVGDEGACAGGPVDQTAGARCPGRFGWAAVHGIAGLGLRDDRLVGTTGDLPLLHAAWPDRLDQNGTLHAMRITMRVSQGSHLGVTFSRAQQLDDDLLRSIRETREATLDAELEPGDDVRTYTLRCAGRTLSMAGIRHILIQPTDVEGAEFAIESIRLVSREEHLRSILSGPSWQGLGEVYRETIVGRSPERIRFDLDPPTRPWLDLAVATIETSPVTFSVHIGRDTVWRRTVATGRWESTRVDRGAYAGDRVSLSLRLESDEGALGFWGSPVVRNAGARRALPDEAEKTPRGVLDGWKLIQDVEPPEWMPPYELYDHVADPIDNHDLSGEHPGAVALRKAELSRRLAQLKARPLGSDDDEKAASNPELDRQLRSLGVSAECTRPASPVAELQSHRRQSVGRSA